MCKFNSRLFVLIALSCPILFQISNAAPAKKSLMDFLTLNEDDYDLYYDQRQNGTENFRLKMDGIFVSLPADPPTSIIILTDELMKIMGGEPNLMGTIRSNLNAPQKQNDHETNNERNLNYSINIPKPVDDAPHQTQQQQIIDNEFYNLKNAENYADKLKFNKGSRTKYHVVNLLDILRRGNTQGTSS